MRWKLYKTLDFFAGSPLDCENLDFSFPWEFFYGFNRRKTCTWSDNLSLRNRKKSWSHRIHLFDNICWMFGQNVVHNVSFVLQNPNAHKSDWPLASNVLSKMLHRIISLTLQFFLQFQPFLLRDCLWIFCNHMFEF